MKKERTSASTLSKEEGHELIEGYYRQGGIGAKSYYTQQGVSEWQFYNWRRRYLQEHPYYLCAGSCDLRKGFDSRSGVVRGEMGRDPLSGEVFIFVNKLCSSIKLLHWERGGLVIYHKRLEQGRFSLPPLDKTTQSFHLGWTDLGVEQLPEEKQVEEAEKETVTYERKKKVEHPAQAVRQALP